MEETVPKNSFIAVVRLYTTCLTILKLLWTGHQVCLNRKISKA